MKALSESRQVVVVLVGLPGTGKSHFSNCVVHGSRKWTRICQDVLRSRKKCEQECAVALARGNNVIIDRTNVNAEQRKHWIVIAKNHDVKIYCICLRASSTNATSSSELSTLVSRCVTRSHHDAEFRGTNKMSQIKRVLSTMARKYRVPRASEGFDDVLFCKDDDASDAMATKIVSLS